MARIKREQQFRIYNSAGSAVEFTFQQEIARPIAIPVQRVYPIEGRVQSITFDVELLDVAGHVTAALADSGGRLALHNRLVEVRQREDGGAWAVSAAGRIASIALTANVSRYVFSVGDERLVERRTELFKGEADTTAVVPHGLRYTLAGNLPEINLGGVEVVHVTKAADAGQDGGRYLLCMLDVDIRTDAALQVIIEDLKDGEDDEYPRQGVVASYLGFAASALAAVAADPTSSAPKGNFKTLRISLDTNDHEIVSFDILPGPGVVANVTDPLPGPNFVQDVQETLATEPVDEDGRPVERKLHCWVAFGDGSKFPSFGSADAVVGAKGTFEIKKVSSDPTDKFPLHIGVDDATHAYGVAATSVGNSKYYGWHPFALLELLYTNARVRMDSAAFTALKNDPKYGFMTLRVTKTWNLATFAETFFYRPYSVLPFIDDQGRIAPKPVDLPNADDVDVDTLFEFNAHNIVSPPTFDTTGRDAVTRVEVEYAIWRYISDAEYQAAATPVAVRGVTRVVDVDTALPMDRVSERPIAFSFDGDRIAQLGTLLQSFSLAGIHSNLLSAAHITRIVRETMARYQDAPIRTLLDATSDADAVLPGQYVKLNVSSYPNLATGERGGVRIMQVLGRGRPNVGPWTFELMDIGPNLQPIAAPTCTVASNSDQPKHSVTVTVGGVPSGGWVIVEHAIGPASAPAATSSLWRTLRIVTSNGAFNHYQLPAGQRIWVRARAVLPNRVASSWSTPDDVVTTSLAVPTSLSMSNIGPIGATLTFTVGEEEYPTEVLLDQAACAGAVYERVTSLPPGQRSYTFFGLKKNATHCVGLRHVDPYGGASTPIASVEFATTNDAISVPNMAGIAMLVGTP